MGRAKEEQIAQQERGHSLPGGFICVEHVEDQALIDQLDPAGIELCVLCGVTDEAFTFDSVVTAVVEAVKDRYESPQNAGVPWDSEESEYAGATILESDQVLEEICTGAIDDEILWELISRIALTLEDDEWTPCRHEDILDSMHWAWEQFEDDVKRSSRFVFFESADNEMSTSATRSSNFLMKLSPFFDPEHGLITKIPAGTEFFRGRLMESPSKEKTIQKMSNAKELGPSPARIAAANRMSPGGFPCSTPPLHPKLQWPKSRLTAYTATP